MNCKIPFTKDIDFEKKIHEITSISLEHEIKVEDTTLKGNFIVTGDFKSHEVSVNKEAFSYILPFEIALIDEVDENTVEFMIEDFTYEVVDTTILRVNIDFNVIASKKETIEEESKEDETFRDASSLFDDSKESAESFIEEVLGENSISVAEKEEEKLEEVMPKEEKEEVIEDGKRASEIEIKQVQEEATSVSEDTIIDSIKAQDDEYTTYHIHMVSDGESVETICTMYNSNINILSEYNEINNLTSGDKLIIPEKNE